MADPSLYVKQPDRFDALIKAIAAARSRKAAAEERWLALAELAEGLTS